MPSDDNDRAERLADAVDAVAGNGEGYIIGHYVGHAWRDNADWYEPKPAAENLATLQSWIEAHDNFGCFTCRKWREERWHAFYWMPPRTFGAWGDTREEAESESAMQVVAAIKKEEGRDV